MVNRTKQQSCGSYNSAEMLIHITRNHSKAWGWLLHPHKRTTCTCTLPPKLCHLCPKGQRRQYHYYPNGSGIHFGSKQDFVYKGLHNLMSCKVVKCLSTHHQQWICLTDKLVWYGKLLRSLQDFTTCMATYSIAKALQILYITALYTAHGTGKHTEGIAS